jgi:polysaccharide biosynthesis transport protein
LSSLRQLPYIAPPLPQPEAPEQDAQPAGMSLVQVLAIGRAHWRISLVIWLSVSCIAAIGIKLLPKTFVATATLILDTGAKDPLAGQEFPVATLASYVATQTELIQSPEVLLAVVKRLNLTSDKEFAAGFHDSGTGAEGLADYVEHNLAATLQVDQGRGQQLIYVSIAAKEAAKAATIANTVAEVYLEQQRRRINGPAGERAQRYSEQLAELRAKADAAEDKIVEFRKQHGITDVGANTDSDNVDSETQALNNLSEHLLEAQNQRRALESKLVGGPASSEELLASQPVQHLQEQLRSLQAQLAQESAVYGPQHPQVLAVKSQLAAVQKSLDAEVRSLSDNVATPLARAKALEEKYTRAVADQRAKVLSLREVQGEGSKLLLELESAETVYKRALDGYDQMMFASADNYTNVSFVSRATAPVSATKPKKAKLLLGAILVALGAALGIPFLNELFLDRRLRCADDIERGFGVPVLAKFGALPAPASPA